MSLFHSTFLLGMQSTVWGDSHMLPSKGCNGLGGLR
jgi:hypothetical protein